MNYWEEVFKGNEGYYYDLDNPSRKIILDYIAPGDSILDMGCGGAALKALTNNPYFGFDYSPRAIEIAHQRHPDAKFMVADQRETKGIFKDNEYDIVVLRHYLENQQDWKATVHEAFRIANKKVIIVMRRPFIEGQTRMVEENNNDTWVWDINWGEFNMLARRLSVNVSYGKIQEEELVIIGKHLDKVVFDLDDFHDTNHNLPILLDLKDRFPKLKVTLFCIPSKCSIKFINNLQDRYGGWMEFAVHGWFHDTDRGPREADIWTEEDAHKYLKMAEDMGIFVKGFRAPGWCINIETYRALRDRGYWVADHRQHDRWEKEVILPRYTTGHLAEVHGHVQLVNMNGLEELATTKCNFGPNSEFRFVSEALDTNEYLPNAY